MTKLSIIVPGYNCADTLEEAVTSIFGQDPVFPFDLTMVDDGSTDGTHDLMLTLARRFPHVRVLQHDTNRGGGAARNTGVAASDGELILCVDGDDVLGPDFLPNMTRFWKRRRSDAVGMSTSVKFRGKSTADVAYVSRYEPAGKRVRFESFLDGSPCALSVVFLMTRSAFARVGGYPTEHAFDTQGMGFRFLCSGMRALICPDTLYYHRVGQAESYYRREEASGRLNWNWLNVLDEFLYLFRKGVKEQLLGRDLFDSPGHPSPQNLSEIVVGQTDIYEHGYRRLLRMGPIRVAKEYAGARDPYWQYWLGNFHRSRGRSATALSHYARALTLGFTFRIIYYRMLQAELALSADGRSARDTLEELRLYTRPFPIEQRPPVQRLYHALLGNRILRGPAGALKLLADRIRGKGQR